MPQGTLPEEDQGSHEKIEGGLRPDETAKLDQIEAGLNEDEISDPREFRDAARQSATNQFSRGLGQKIGRWAGQNRRKLIFGSIAGGLVSAIVAGFFALLPLKLIHFKELLFDRNFAVGENFERVRGYRMMRSVLKGPKINDGGGRRVNCATGGFICDVVTNWKLDRFEQKLDRRGYKFDYGPDGRLTKIRRVVPGTDTPRPDPVTGATEIDLASLDDISRKNALFGTIDEAIPAWRIGKRIKYRALMSRRTGVAWKFFRRPGESPPSDDADMRTRVDDRVNGRDSEVRALLDTDRDGVPDGSDPDINDDGNGDGASDGNDAEARMAGDEFGQVANDARAAARENGTSIRSETARISRSRIGLRAGIGITGLIAAVCGIQDLLNNLADTVTIQRTQQLIQTGNLLLVTSSHLKDGQVQGQDLNDFMRLFESYETQSIVDSSGNDTGRTRQVYSGAETAVSYKIAAEEPITEKDRRERDLSEDAHPSRSAVGRLSEAVNEIVDFVPGGQLLCDVATNAVGQIFMGIVEIGAAIFSGGSTAAAGVAASFAAQEAFSRTVLPRIISYVLNASVGGFVDGFQFFNNIDAGLNLSANTEYASNIGGGELTGAEYEEQYRQVKRLAREEFQQKSLAHRLFAPEDHNSLISKMAAQMPVSGQGAVAKIAALPGAFSHSLAKIFLGLRPAMAESEGSVFGAENRYNFKLYGFKEEELAAYEWDQNESYMEQVIGDDIVPDDCDVVAEHKSRKRWEIMEFGYDYMTGPRCENRVHQLGYGEACFDIEYTGGTPIRGGEKPEHPYTDENEGLCKTLGASPDSGSNRKGNDQDDIQPITNANVRSSLYCPGANGNCTALTDQPHFPGDSYTPAHLNPADQAQTEMLAYRLYRLDRHIACNYETGMSDQSPLPGCPQPPGATPTGTAAVGPGAVTDPTQDTSAQQCTIGSDGGIHPVERRDSSGNVTATFNIRVCIVRGVDVNVSIERQFDSLMAAAQAAGHNFGGGGFRSYQEQIALRRSNCGTSNYAVYQMSPSQCSPPTARPGQSMHEVGLAIDFTIGGSTLRSGTPAFSWLVNNAATYGFHNLPSESWHWSTSGG
jgi:hypothetical protein